jgi:hypothetical protein
MKVRNIMIIVFALVMVLWFVAPVTRASEWDESSQITFSQPVQIPGNTVLPAGTYWFEIANSATDRNIVQIFDVNLRPIASVIARSTQMDQPSDDTVLTFAQRSPDQPVLLLKWFYPDNTIGHEFVYSGAIGQAIADQAVKIETVVAHPSPEAAPNSASITSY